MAYVEAHSTLREHPKTKKLARALSISRGTAIGHLLFLWWWCQDYAKDGNLSTCSAEEIAEAAGWEGDPVAFVEAMLSCGKTAEAGFLELAPDGALLIHDWYDYGGKLFIQRKQGAVRQANWRARQAGKIPPEDVTPRNENVTPLQDVSNALVTHNVTQSNAYRIEEIRKEENRGKEIAATPPAPPPAPKKVKEILPVQAQTYLDNGGAFPTGTLTDGTTKRARAIQFITEHVTDDPVSLHLWGRVVAGYAMQWSAKSYTVMVNDYYLAGRVPGEPQKENRSNGNNGNGNQKPGYGLASLPKGKAAREPTDAERAEHAAWRAKQAALSSAG